MFRRSLILLFVTQSHSLSILCLAHHVHRSLSIGTPAPGALSISQPNAALRSTQQQHIALRNSLYPHLLPPTRSAFGGTTIFTAHLDRRMMSVRRAMVRTYKSLREKDQRLRLLHAIQYLMVCTAFPTIHPQLILLFSPAVPCDEAGASLPPGSALPPREAGPGWSPFRNRAEFELAEFIYKEEQISERSTERLLELIEALLVKHGDIPPFASFDDLCTTIDSIHVGDIPWQSFSTRYTGALPMAGDPPHWMTAEYEVHFRDPDAVARQLLDNPDFASDFDYTPCRDFDEKGGRVYSNFMSGDWFWRQADSLSSDPANGGAMVVPLILGSDKTTVSVATGQNEYYPLYMSIGNVSNGLRRAHRGAVVLIGFLATPKSALNFSIMRD